MQGSLRGCGLIYFILLVSQGADANNQQGEQSGLLFLAQRASSLGLRWDDATHMIKDLDDVVWDHCNYCVMVSETAWVIRMFNW